ncbi:PepSY-associated TM helix domain-containing protein [Nitrosomonas aestuarii]|uniref:PepSY-associated TM helix domain-containing protein n=1 Tax=Nitrosomonas aestuarii TaxID=52441 RepID=UPI000D4609F0|nr:PepSY-associated TM helix domain-containing protein [Nitrosomonas aestuarii]PTN12395.1 putative iron-regulated membrane protein [Nitrosomonas aestuarii]
MLKVRRIVFNLHLYTGLVAGFFLVIVSLTGSLIVFREEIETFIYPELMTTEAGVERVPVQTILDAVKRAYPQDSIFSLRMPRMPEQTYLLKMNNAHDLFVYADTYSGELIGAHQQKDTFMGWVTLMHTQLLFGERGKIILGVGGLLLICMGVTGLYLWYPPSGRVSQGFGVNWSSSWKKVIFDMHRALGIYTVFFLLIIAITGVCLVFNKTTAELFNFLTVSPPRLASPLSDPSRKTNRLPSVDDLLQQADRLLPVQTTWISFPQTPQSSWIVRKKNSAELHPNGRSFIFFDQYIGEMLLFENALTAPLGTRIYNLLYPVHVGVAGGLPTRILQAIAGFFMTVLFFTGYVMWRNKRKTEKRKQVYKVSLIKYAGNLLDYCFCVSKRFGAWTLRLFYKLIS